MHTNYVEAVFVRKQQVSMLNTVREILAERGVEPRLGYSLPVRLLHSRLRAGLSQRTPQLFRNYFLVSQNLPTFPHIYV
jgi:hypothetical protein